MVAIVVGELPRSFDPAVSEWGNLPALQEFFRQVTRFIGTTNGKYGNHLN